MEHQNLQPQSTVSDLTDGITPLSDGTTRASPANMPPNGQLPATGQAANTPLPPSVQGQTTVNHSSMSIAFHSQSAR